MGVHAVNKLDGCGELYDQTLNCIAVHTSSRFSALSIVHLTVQHGTIRSITLLVSFSVFAEKPCMFFCFLVRSAAIGRVWSGNGRAEGARRLATGAGVVRPPKGGAVHRIPRFPPLADQVLCSRRGCFTSRRRCHLSALLLTRAFFFT